jgi:hypothetical protein
MAFAATTRPRGRPAVWTPRRVREELAIFVGETHVMPTNRELAAAGRDDLRYAIARHGGVRYWANELSLELRPRQLGPVAEPDELLELARRVVKGFGHLPGANKLRQLGYRDLAMAVLRSGGSRAYCRRYGLPYLDGRTSAVRRRRTAA